MIAKRILGAAGAGILLGSMGALAACSANTDEAAGAKETLQSANVALTAYDASGNVMARGSGVMIAPGLVLTSGHLIAGYAKWSITTADGKETVMGHKGLTKDWFDYDSMKSHPRKTDVGVIYLDKTVSLKSFPALTKTRQADGTSLTRVSHQGQAFNLIAGAVSHFRSFPYAYVTDMPTSETLDTGGAVVNDKGEIIGVVTGRGMNTGKLHIARIDHITDWLAPKQVCAGGSAAAPSSLGIRTYGTPPPADNSNNCDAGTGVGSSGGTNGSSGGTTGSSGSSGSSGSGDNSSGGNSGSSDSCGDNNGNCSGSGCSGGSGSNGSGSNSGSNSGANGGSTDGSGGTGGGGGSTTGSSGGTNTGSNSGANGGSTSGGTGGAGGSSDSNGGSSTGNGGASGGGDQCQGSNDNPDVCPPEAYGCEGVNCGGGSPDATIDYGNAGSPSSPTGSPVIR